MRQKNYGRSMSTQDEPEHMINGISQKKNSDVTFCLFFFIHSYKIHELFEFLTFLTFYAETTAYKI